MEQIVCVLLTPASKVTSLNWCRRHVQWSKEVSKEYCLYCLQPSHDIV